jgi:hypothetical protein
VSVAEGDLLIVGAGTGLTAADTELAAKWEAN